MTRKIGSLNRNEAMAGYLFVAPTVIGFLVFVLVPTFSIFFIALYKWDLIGEPVYVGLHNYVAMFNDPHYFNTLKVSALYVLYNLPPQYLIALFMALILKKLTKGQKVFRTIILLPWITTPIAISVVWKWALNQRLGLVNHYLSLIGVPHAIDWFSSPYALATIAAVNIWEFTGFSTILFLVGLQSIPNEYYEAGKVDGTNVWNEFFRITLPLLKPTILYQTVVGVIGSFQVFDTIFGMTKGGPGEATNVYYFAVYQDAFQFLNMGYASGMCVILLLILMFSTALQLYLFRDRD